MPDREDDDSSAQTATFRSYLHKAVIQGLWLSGHLSEAELDDALAVRSSALAEISDAAVKLIGVRVFAANFGEKNYAWPECLKRNAIATMNPVAAQPFWEARDKEGNSKVRSKDETAAGKLPTSRVLGRWFNSMTEIAESEGDLWLHGYNNGLWWTTSTDKPPVFEQLTETVGRKRDVIVCYKPCRPRSNKNTLGEPLLWASLHPKAKDIFIPQGTHAKLSSRNADYVRALINGEDLSFWHGQPNWISKSDAFGSYEWSEEAAIDNSIKGMIESVTRTTGYANGQTIERKVKNKDLKMSKAQLQDCIANLIDTQGKRCKISHLPLQFVGRQNNDHMLASLDRIDSSGHYEVSNLQVVCRFTNMCKSDMNDDEFRRLLAKVQNPEAV